MEGNDQGLTVSISSPEDEAVFAQNDSIAFEGTAEGPDGEALTEESLTWEVSTEPPFGTGEPTEIGTGEQVTTVLPSAPHTVVLVATAPSDATARDTVSVAVNGPPVASIDAPEDESGVDEGAFTLEGTGVDPVDGELSGDALEWTSDVDEDLGGGMSLSPDLSPGPHTLTLMVTDSDDNTALATADIVVEQPEEFNVRFRFQDGLSADVKETVRAAATPWETAITGDLSPGFLSSDLAGACRLLGARGIDDLATSVQVVDIDGPGQTLAAAAPCAARTAGPGNFTTSLAGIIIIDQADIDNPQLEEIVTHELGHVIGIGTTWSATSDLDTVDPSHEGENTTTAFEELNGSEAYLSEGVPLEPFGGPGTARSHWAELNFENELMTGFLSSDNPFSTVTIAALQDIGYEVDLQAADDYQLPSVQATNLLAEADATLSRSASAGENFGAPQGGQLDSILVAGSNNDQLWSSEDPEEEVFTGLVRFNTPASSPTGLSVEFAGAWLQGEDTNAETTDHNVGIYSVGESWSESEVTWNDRPALPALQDSITAFDFQSCDPTCGEISSDAPRPILPLASQGLEVTSVVQSWLDGGENNGLALRAPDATSDPTFSVSLYNRHVQRSPLLPPFVRVFAQVGTGGGGAVRAKDLSLNPNDLSGAPRSGEKIPLGDDILEGTIYGVDADGNIVKTKRIR